MSENGNCYEALEEHYKKIGNLRHLQSIGSWDESAMMPAGGGDARSDAMSTLGIVIHELVTDTKVAELIAAAKAEPLDAWQSANLREIDTEHRQATCLPADFVGAQTKARYASEQAWRVHRAANDFESMRPHLEEVVKLARQESEIRASATGLGQYDSMLELYEPGMTSARLDELFAPLKEFLPGFIDDVIARQAKEPVLSVGDYFPIEKQRELGLRMMDTLGFDFDHGRLDVSHHPFCGGVQEDVRITTRYTTENFIESLMAVIHETGHALYEQGRPVGWRGQPVSKALSSGTHESQSLLMEMQACRSKEFVSFAAPVMREVFGTNESDPAWCADNLHRLYTRVDKGFIRVDADELTYPLHVILRFEIEKELIEGKLEVTGIPDAWRERMLGYLGVETKGNFTDGCLQDVHWPCGLFGYFPTYTLGAMMAAQIFDSAKREMPDVLEHIGQGKFSPLRNWLRENIHGKGKLLSADELLTNASGEVLNPSFFLNHLKRRYG